MKSWRRILPALLALVTLPACLWGPGGELGDAGQLRFDTPNACYSTGCDQLRGIAVGTDVRIGISDADCDGSEGSFSVSVTGSGLEIVGDPSPLESYENRCWTYVTVRAVAEGSGSVTATSPNGGSDSYSLFAAEPATVTVPDGGGWASRADAQRIEIEVDEIWGPQVRVSDASLRPLVHDSYAVTWESADPEIVGSATTIGGATLFMGLAPGETTMTGQYGELEVAVDVAVVTPEP